METPCSRAGQLHPLRMKQQVGAGPNPSHCSRRWTSFCGEPVFPLPNPAEGLDVSEGGDEPQGFRCEAFSSVFLIKRHIKSWKTWWKSEEVDCWLIKIPWHERPGPSRGCWCFQSEEKPPQIPLRDV